MRTAIFTLAFVVPSQLFAQVTKPSTLFTELCVTEHSTGFDWVGDEWKQTSYRPYTYVIRKLTFLVAMVLQRRRCDLQESFLLRDVTQLLRLEKKKKDKSAMNFGMDTMRCFGSAVMMMSSSVRIQT
jgi:hypothetical protein